MNEKIIKPEAVLPKLAWTNPVPPLDQQVSAKSTDMSNVRNSKSARSLGDSGDPPHNGVMEARVSALEEFAKDARDRLTRIEGKLDHAATKSDLSDAISGQIKWMVGTAAVLGSAAIVVMTFVLNNAVPKPTAIPAPIIQPTQQPPIIINVPAPAVPSAQGKK